MTNNKYANKELASTPQAVTRGVKTQVVNLGLDSLYLVLEYSSDDLYRHWSYPLNTGEASHDDLNKGIPYDGMVLRRGGLGYKLSVWDGDARLFLTDQVNENLEGTYREGQGMGVMLQLGPKWLQAYGDVVATEKMLEHIYAQFSVFGIWEPESYRVRLNRIDIALDIWGMRVADFPIDDWRQQWVGRTFQRVFHDAATDGKLETISIGTSSGAVRFKVYDKVAEATKNETLGFWQSVWGIDQLTGFDVARFEWTIKPYQAKIVQMQYLDDFTFEGFLGLLNYVSLKWGRLCIPQADERNKQRWELSPFWQEIRAHIDDWSVNYQGSVKRQYNNSPDIKESYLRNLAGSLSGLMAKLGLGVLSAEGPVELDDALGFLHEAGFTKEWLKTKAQEKWNIWSRLSRSYGESKNPPHDRLETTNHNQQSISDMGEALDA